MIIVNRCNCIDIYAATIVGMQSLSESLQSWAQWITSRSYVVPCKETMAALCAVFRAIAVTLSAVALLAFTAPSPVPRPPTPVPRPPASKEVLGSPRKA